MSNNQAGKGSKPRPFKKSEYDKNYELIFNKKTIKQNEKNNSNGN